MQTGSDRCENGEQGSSGQEVRAIAQDGKQLLTFSSAASSPALSGDAAFVGEPLAAEFGDATAVAAAAATAGAVGDEDAAVAVAAAPAAAAAAAAAAELADPGELGDAGVVAASAAAVTAPSGEPESFPAPFFKRTSICSFSSWSCWTCACSAITWAVVMSPVGEAVRSSGLGAVSAASDGGAAAAAAAFAAATAPAGGCPPPQAAGGLALGGPFAPSSLLKSPNTLPPKSE